MIREARAQGQARPRFESTVSAFTVTMSSSALLAPEVVSWLERIPGLRRSRERDIALAMLYRGSLTNEMLREWGMDRITAGAVLRDLVRDEVALKQGGRRYASYSLSGGAESARAGRWSASVGSATAEGFVGSDTAAAVRSALDGGTARSAREIAEATGLHRNTVLNALNAGVEDGWVDAIGAARSPQRRYMLRSGS